MNVSKYFETSFEFYVDDTELIIEVGGTIVRETNYGADADGNRGEDYQGIEDLDIKVLFEGKDVAALVNSLDSKVFEDIESQAESELWDAVESYYSC